MPVPVAACAATVGALEQDALALAALEIQQPPYRLGVRQQFRRKRQQTGQDLVTFEFGQVEAPAQRVVMRQQAVDLVGQRIGIGEIHQPDGAAADLVLIGRADAALGGADGMDRVAGFAQRIEVTMQRQNQRDVLGDAQIVRADGDALTFQFSHLVEEGLRIEHDAIADHGQLRGPQHAGRQQRQLVGLAVDDKRMAGIVAALEAHDDIGLLRQPVDDLALPFVAPLGADDDNIGHF
jgi:hypothetical protein